MPELSEKQKRFCQEYMKDLNGTQAAIRAGYSKKTAKEIASQHLTKLNIQEEIKKLQDKHANKVNITVEDLLRELQMMYQIDISELYDENGDLKPINELPKNITRSISEVTVVTKKFGETIATDTSKIKFYSKLDAIEKLARHLGFYEADNMQKTIELPVKLVINRDEIK